MYFESFQAAAELMVNDTQRCTAYSASNSGHLNPAHNTLIKTLKKGDVVFTRAREFSDSFILDIQNRK